ncbi:YecA family protein [Xanthomonas maliensis]|uniref:YecA/YgfB family protein n=1 Tax=Xanthomonas maliensis TaxID=1321368 RepID=UPI00039A405E|nr:YecA family protein [Xanthomonas maliensis]KAB7770736.1 YecA family protein [Xanthomonas maliensis]
MDLPDVGTVQHESRQLALASSAAELHGGLCGWLAGGGADSDDWLARILADGAQVAPPPGGALDRMRQATVAQLEDRDFAFELLLAEDGAAVAARADALFDWCRAFLGGFGLAAQQRPALSEEGEEALQDLARLAQASSEDFDSAEEDDTALAEIEEFVRVAVLLLHGDCVMGPRYRQRLN